jgi:hypothetical protein
VSETYNPFPEEAFENEPTPRTEEQLKERYSDTFNQDMDALLEKLKKEEGGVP